MKYLILSILLLISMSSLACASDDYYTISENELTINSDYKVILSENINNYTTDNLSVYVSTKDYIYSINKSSGTITYKANVPGLKAFAISDNYIYAHNLIKIYKIYKINGTLETLRYKSIMELFVDNPVSGIGEQGVQGVPGINGTDGIDGINGTDGIDGINGTNGIDGTNGTDGYLLHDDDKLNRNGSLGMTGNLNMGENLIVSAGGVNMVSTYPSVIAAASGVKSAGVLTSPLSPLVQLYAINDVVGNQVSIYSTKTSFTKYIDMLNNNITNCANCITQTNLNGSVNLSSKVNKSGDNITIGTSESLKLGTVNTSEIIGWNAGYVYASNVLSISSNSSYPVEATFGTSTPKNVNHVVEIWGGENELMPGVMKTPLVLAYGGIEIYADDTPSSALSIGNSVPGTTPTTNFIIGGYLASQGYWTQYFAVNGTNRMMTATNITVSALSGTGNAFSCLDASGRLFRSAIACDLI